MKKQIGIYGLLLVLIICVGCEKEPFDYRNKFVGDWEFKVVRTEFNMASGEVYRDSLTYSGKINYGSDRDELRIIYTADNSITLKIDKEDTLHNFPTQYCSGAFEGKDKLSLYLRWGGLGGGTIHKAEGEKK